MNPIVQRYLPPLIVIGSAAYFGWPPSKPLDLGDDIVRATSVRWDNDDLREPTLPPITADPFREVIVAEEDPAEMVAEELAIPTGPDPAVIQSGLSLDGFADTAGRRWAIINGRPRLAGDIVTTTGIEAYRCEIVAVEAGHVVVRCQQTVTEIRPLPFGTKSQPNQQPSSLPAVDVQPETATENIAPPPQA